MGKTIELLAGHWTLAGECYPMGPTEVSPFSLRERAEAASVAGYTGMGLVHDDLMASVARMGLAGIKQVLTDNGIAHIELEFIGDWFETGEKKAASDRVKGHLLEAAATLGARDIKIAPQMWTDVIDIPRFAAAFARVCEDAKAIGTNIAMEMLPMTNVRTLKVATEIVRQARQDNGGLCIDIWHVVRGGQSFDDVRKLPVSYLKSVELNDANAEMVGSQWNDTLHHRVLCGEGVFDVRGFIKAIQATGFTGVYGVEILSQTHRKLPLREQAKRSFDSTMAHFQAAR
jgi:sugar phosphate isomerase/epimerase